MIMTGWDRTYMAPRAIRGEVPVNSTAWDLLRLSDDTPAGVWAGATLDSLLATAEAQIADALGCTDCQDTGFYGVADPEDPDMLTGLIRRVGAGAYQGLQTCGAWDEWDPKGAPLEVLSLDLAGDLAAAITGGACGLVRRHLMPRAFLPPCPVLSAAPLRDALTSLVSPQPPGNTETSDNDWITYAVVDELDPGAVLDLVRIRAAGAPELERWDETSWTPDSGLLAEGGLPTVRLSEAQLADVQEQLNPNAIVAGVPGIGRPGDAERLRRYWTTGKGGAKIRWTAPGSGDFNRCYRQLKKYMGLRAKGYCAKLHRRATGVWPGDHRNTGRPLRSSLSPEESLLASIRTGQWGRTKERNPGMPLEMEMLSDGIYYEGDEENAGLIKALTAGAFPVAPPDAWYDNPNLTSKTPMVVEDSGRVYGHIATWDVTHIGIASPTPAPHSASGYQYFLTGSLKTESGKQVNVGQLTCAGGHADVNGNVQAAVAHYDDTGSAVADVTCGEDEYGIWVAGGMRPSATPEQVRVFLASPPSGDWRPVNGHLELVACCSVNVPGFMNVRPTARVAGGAVLALVAAGTRELTEIRQAMLAAPAVLSRLTAVEEKVQELGTPVTAEPVAEPVVAAPEAAAAVVETPPTTPVVEPESVVAEIPETPAPVEPELPTLTPDQAARAEHISRVRGEVAALRKEQLRARMGVTAAGGPPDVAALKSAIKEAGPFPSAATKKKLSGAALGLKRPDLIPTAWKKATA
jgi:hypothetical protein